MSICTEVTYRLLHDRRTREAFLRRDFEAAGIPDDLREDFAAIDVDDLKRAADKVHAQLKAMLKSDYPRIFSEWSSICPDDPEANELVFLYLASPEYERSVNFAASPDERPLVADFPKFLELLSLE